MADPHRGAGRAAGREVERAVFSADGRHVLLVGDAEGRGWDLSPGTQSVEDLVSMAQVLAQRRLDVSGGLIPLAPKEFLDAWQAVRSRHPDAFTRPAEEAPALKIGP